MRDLSLLNELELKIREMASALEREKARNANTTSSQKLTSKLARIEGKLKKLINLIDQLEK